MPPKKQKIYACDFETTVYQGQTRTDVWAAGCVEFWTENVKIFHSIDEQFQYFCDLKENLICYYHNLKFDGAFWMDFLLTRSGLRHGIKYIDKNEEQIPVFDEMKEIENNTYIYTVSGTGQWYRIYIKYKGHTIDIRDSLKLLPFSVKEIGKSFKTKHVKLDMEYTGFRYPGCAITDEEEQYLANDLLVIKEALEIMYEQGHKRLTIGSCCLAEYKRLISNETFEDLFPNIYEIELDPNIYGVSNAGEYVKKSYRGGWCYVARGKENIIHKNGFTADVNSLYPSMMHSESGNKYPVFKPFFWSGNYIPKEAIGEDKFFFVRIKTRFDIKKGYLPFVQIKNTLRYGINVMLETSDMIVDGVRHRYYKDFDGTVKENIVELTLTEMDWRLLNKHYNLPDCEILDGCYFTAMKGIFDVYIDKYKKIKLESSGAMRELAKLFLNNLYGKMASNTISDYKVAVLKEDGSIGFKTVVENNKTPGYIPVGSAITSYARNFTITAAQKNYHGKNKAGFIYADTDSIHCDIPLSQVKGLTIHDKNFCCWKIESEWDEGLFVRQKTYIEHVIKKDKANKLPFYDLKCAGMGNRSKKLFLKSIGEDVTDLGKLNEAEEEFLKTERTLKDFKRGLQVPGALTPKRIPGGIVLEDNFYVIR